MKNDKRICIQCRGYATSECKEHSVYNVGTAFRPPKKSRVMAWKKLEQLYAGVPAGSTLYFSRHPSRFNYSTPKSVKENCEIERLKQRKLELQKIHSEKKDIPFIFAEGRKIYMDNLFLSGALACKNGKTVAANPCKMDQYTGSLSWQTGFDFEKRGVNRLHGNIEAFRKAMDYFHQGSSLYA